MSIERFDLWLNMNGPVAVVIREELEPVQGKQSVFFPPTFAPPEKSKDAPPSYLIDSTSKGNVALVDTIGSQANRMEPIFKESPYADLIPTATIKVGEREINLLDVGHRAADAVVRFSDQWGKLRKAFLAIRDNKNATPLAKMAPTSLVFGAWDSRDTQVKLPRLVGSTIRAYEVDKLTRSAQFFAATDKSETEGLAPGKKLSKMGLDDAPSGRLDGGIISRGGIVREATLNFIALRALSGSNPADTRKLQRYLLGLALNALLAPSQRYLREGCLLVPTSDKEQQIKIVERTGERKPWDVKAADILEFAQAAANDFGVGEAWVAIFNKNSAQEAAKKIKEDKES